MWVTSMRMEIVKDTNKSYLKFLDVLLEFRQFWALTESKSAFPAILQGLQHPSPSLDYSSYTSTENEQRRPCLCGKRHAGKESYYLVEGKAPSRFQQDNTVVKKFKDACHRHKFRTFIRKADWTSNWLKEFVNLKWPAKDENQSTNSHSPLDGQNNRGIFITSIGSTSLATRLAQLLQNEILLDNGADGHVCNNLALAVSALTPPQCPAFVQPGAGTCPIIGYGDMVFPAHLGKGKNFEMTITNFAFAPEFLTSVMSWKVLKRKGVKWNSDTNFTTYNGQTICQLIDRRDHDVFTGVPISVQKKITQRSCSIREHQESQKDLKLSGINVLDIQDKMLYNASSAVLSTLIEKVQKQMSVKPAL
ncbi:hypothetical protein K3495_g1553 [Podosphaera aphanis]|nr:hypothetical protein K3495_g1553 [Podosphaera aphanis]